MTDDNDGDDRNNAKFTDDINQGNDFLEDYFNELLSFNTTPPLDEVDQNVRQNSSVKNISLKKESIEKKEHKKPLLQNHSLDKNPQLTTNTAPLPAAKTETTIQKKLDRVAIADNKEEKKKLQKLLDQSINIATPNVIKTNIKEKTVQTVSEVVKTEAKPQINEKVDVQEKKQTKIASEIETKTKQNTIAKLAWNENGRPEWAQEKFDVLLFEVSGLTLAVPLICLGQIHTIDNNLTPLFGQSEWFLGLMQTPLGKIKTINTALFVMPEQYQEKSKERLKYVITIDKLPWGLAVDKVNQPVLLKAEDVKWRTQRTTRPWLAGTVKSAMCALIDIPKMGEMLNKA